MGVVMTTTEQQPESPAFDVEALEAGTADIQVFFAQAFGDPEGDDSTPDADAGEGTTDAAPPADAEGGEQVQGADLEPVLTTLGYIDTVISDPNKFAEVPETHKSVVANAVNAIMGGIHRAQSEAEQRGMQLGERMAVLNELFREDPEAFAEEVAKTPGEEAQFYEWRSMIARRAGVDNEEMQAIRTETGQLLGSLQNNPEWRSFVVAQANEEGFRQTREDLDKLKELVSGARMMIRMGFASPPNAPAGAGAQPPASASAPRPAAQRAANAARVNALPKPDISGASNKGKPLVDVTKLNESGSGSRLIEAALRQS